MKLIQKHLLKRLIDKNGLKYSEIAEGYDYEDNVVYHLKHLIKLGYINKRDQLYFLTKQGLAFSGKIYLPDLKIINYKTMLIGLLVRYKDQIVLREKVKDNDVLYRLPGTKPFLGEKPNEYFPRICYEEIGIKLAYSRAQLNSIQNKIQLTSKNTTLFDNPMFVYEVKLTSAESENVKLKQQNKWFPINQIQNLLNVWPEIIIALNPKRKFYSEYEFASDYLIESKDL